MVANLQILLQDEVVQVQKRVIQAVTQMFRVMLQWLAGARTVTDVMESAWNMMTQIKLFIFQLIESDNDG